MEVRRNRLPVLVLMCIGLLAVTPMIAVAEVVDFDHPRACMFIVAGKDASADGAVLMAYNNDYIGNNALRVEVVPRKQWGPEDTFTLMHGQELPQPEETYRYVRLINHLQPEYSKNVFYEGGMNEHQVGVVYGTWASAYRDEINELAPPVEDGLGDEMWHLILERAQTAEEGVTVFGELIEEYGVSMWAIGTFAIGDPDEVWWIEMGGGHQWAARRVPDDAYVAAVNALQIREVDLDDPDNYRGSPDVISFAQEAGTYCPEEDGAFDFAKAYGGTAPLLSPGNANRVWAAQSAFTPSAEVCPEDAYEDRHVFLAPDEKLVPADLMAVMRDHYEGTELDLTEGYELGSPHYTDGRPICVSTTNYSVVWQLRDWLPNEVGGVMWVAMASPCASTYLPFYAGITTTPDVYQIGDGNYDTESAFWAYREINNLVSGHYGALIGGVQAVWAENERRLFAYQDAIEAMALYHYQDSEEADVEQARALLTEYVCTQAEDAYRQAKELAAELHLQITHQR